MDDLVSSLSGPGAHDADMDGDPTLAPDPLEGVRRCPDERVVGVGGSVAAGLVDASGAGIVGTGGACVVGVRGPGVEGRDELGEVWAWW